MNIPELINLSLSDDEATRNAASQQLESILEDPASIQLFFACYRGDADPKNRNRYLTYIKKILAKHWANYNEDQQIQIYQELDNYVKVTEDSKNIRSLSDILVDLFVKFGENYESPIFQALFTSQFPEFVFYWFVIRIDDIPDEIIQKYYQNLFELANWGLNQPNFTKFADSIRLFLSLIGITKDLSIFAPLFESILTLLPNESNLPNKSKSLFWALITQFLNKGMLTLDHFDLLLQAVSQSTCTEAINCFEEIIPKLSPEQLTLLFKLDSEILANKLATEGTLEDSDFFLLYSAISEADAKKLVFALIQALITADEIHQCTGIYLFVPLLEAANISANDEVQFIFNCIQTALRSTSSEFQEAALRIIDKFEDTSSELKGIFPDLIQITLNYLPSENEKIRLLAYKATKTLLEECDSEIEGLLMNVWELLPKGMVPELSLPDFISLICTIIDKTETLDDDIIDTIMAWLETFYTGEKDISIRSAALLLTDALIKKDESLENLLIPPSVATVQEAFASGENDSIRNACIYLQTIASTLKHRSAEIIKPFTDNLKSAMIEDNQYKSLALETASIYSGYANDTSLCDVILPLVSQMIESNDEIDQSAACDSLIYLSRILKENPISFDLYQLVINTLSQEKDQQLLQTAFIAAKSLYKRCINTKREQYMEVTYNYLIQLMSGGVAFLDGCESPFNHPKMNFLIEAIMELFSVFFKSNPGDVTTICMNFIQWLGQADEDTAFPIFSTLTDAFEFGAVNETIPRELCQYLQAKGESIQNPDLQQNISYFLALLCRKSPESAALANQVMPLIVDWWKRGHAKNAGYKEALDNMASFFLSYAVIDPSLPEELIVGALQQIPPTDLLETEDMVKSALGLLSKKQDSVQILLNTALALSRLFTESQSQLDSRKIPDDVVAQAITILKQLMSIHDIQQVVLAQYVKSKSKKARLLKVLQ